MSCAQKSGSQWGHSYRLIASQKWKNKSAAMGRDATEALVDYARPQPGMQVLDLPSGTGEPAITLASRIGREGHEEEPGKCTQWDLPGYGLRHHRIDLQR
jgi:ubiquinone/menaquinone biosynthesis C-methylase UbiE